MNREATQILNKFDSALEDLICEHLVGQVTKDEVNEFYGWSNDCQIAEALISAEELDELLRSGLNS